jgi:hypothetical protein
MRGRQLLVVTLVAGACGAVCGEVTRGRGGGGPGRPAAVEAVLKAVDADDRASLARALAAAGDASRFASPWKEEVELGRVVASGDMAAVLNFGATPSGAARARALLYVREKAPDPAQRERAQRLLAERYPTSWALGPARGAVR